MGFSIGVERVFSILEAKAKVSTTNIQHVQCVPLHVHVHDYIIGIVLYAISQCCVYYFT